jgi:hypothetical protein
MCEEFTKKFMNEFESPVYPNSSRIVQNGGWSKLTEYTRECAEICHLCMEIQEIITLIDNKIGLLQDHLLGLKKKATYR